MPETILVIGDKRRSSWSLRAWLFLRHHGVPFREETIALDRPGTRADILKRSPSGKVPCLIHGNVKVWESLAICEAAADLFKLRDAWPTDAEPRALARSIACEMHAGFADLRRELAFDATRMPQTQPLAGAAAADVQRIRQIWRDVRGRFGKDGEWLFGRFGIADAMFAPVAVRLHSYGVPLDGPEKDYVRSVLSMPALREWMGAALLESDSDAPLLPAPAATPAPAPTPKSSSASTGAAPASAQQAEGPGDSKMSDFDAAIADLLTPPAQAKRPAGPKPAPKSDKAPPPPESARIQTTPGTGAIVSKIISS